MYNVYVYIANTFKQLYVHVYIDGKIWKLFTLLLPKAKAHMWETLGENEIVGATRYHEVQGEAIRSPRGSFM